MSKKRIFAFRHLIVKGKTTCRIKEMKKNAKKITKRILLAIFCSLLILFMVFSLLSGIFHSHDENDSGDDHNHNHAHAIVEILR